MPVHAGLSPNRDSASLQCQICYVGRDGYVGLRKNVDPDVTVVRRNVDSRTILQDAAGNPQTLRSVSARMIEEQSLLPIVETHVVHPLFACPSRKHVCGTENRTLGVFPALV